jgi:ankyrin repeat protein
MYAAIGNQEAAVNCLLEEGANYMLTDKVSKTALSLCSFACSLGTVFSTVCSWRN